MIYPQIQLIIFCLNHLKQYKVFFHNVNYYYLIIIIILINVNDSIKQELLQVAAILLK